MPSVRAEETAETTDLALGRALIQLRNAADDGRLPLLANEDGGNSLSTAAAVVLPGAPLSVVALDVGRLPPSASRSHEGTAVVTYSSYCTTPPKKRRWGTTGAQESWELHEELVVCSGEMFCSLCLSLKSRLGNSELLLLSIFHADGIPQLCEAPSPSRPTTRTAVDLNTSFAVKKQNIAHESSRINWIGKKLYPSMQPPGIY